MLVLSSLLLLISIAVDSKRDKSILYGRIVMIIVLFCYILSTNSLYAYLHVEGLALFGGLDQTSAITPVFHTFVILFTTGITLFNLSDRITSESFGKRFLKLIILIWNNKFNYALYIILICSIIYILSSSYTALFNFNVNSPFICHLVRLHISELERLTVRTSYTNASNMRSIGANALQLDLVLDIVLRNLDSGCDRHLRNEARAARERIHRASLIRMTWALHGLILAEIENLRNNLD